MNHKTIPAVTPRPLALCNEEGCAFLGKEAQQGVCHSSEGEVIDWDKAERYEKLLLEDLKFMKETEGEGYVACLEANYVCAMMNWETILDECVRLRRDAALRGKS